VLLVTDFDGTLADIVRDPAMASLRPDIAAALPPLVERLRGVVILSSRGSSDLKRLVPIAGVASIGDYGMGPPTAAERQALARFNEAAANLVRDLPGVRIEPKSVGTSIHFRNSPASGQAVVERLAPLVAAEGLQARTGRLAFEVTLRRASKGESLERLVRQSQPEGVVYLGDDANDKPAFEYLARSPMPSFAVGVGSTEIPDDLFAACDLILPGVAAVPVFLSSLAGWAQRRGASGPRAGG
jgi:trehalose 6-phosphate phosphatase